MKNSYSSLSILTSTIFRMAPKVQQTKAAKAAAALAGGKKVKRSGTRVKLRTRLNTLSSWTKKNTTES